MKNVKMKRKKSRKYKPIYLVSSTEDGYKYQLRLSLYEKTTVFRGDFQLTVNHQNARNALRSKDRHFFINRLGKKYMKDKVIHHSWFNGTAKTNKAILVDKFEHSNGGVGRSGIKKHVWEALEDWF